MNASWHGDFIRQYHNIDISIAVQTPSGLMVPVVKDSNSLGLTEIGTAVKALAGKVRAADLRWHCIAQHSTAGLGKIPRHNMNISCTA